jgi:iron complex outermembrane receptor protein
VVSGDALTALATGGQDIRQLAFSVPSLNIESSNGRTFPRFYIRGYGNTDFTSFASQPVSLVYDDIVQENPALKGFPIFDQADVEVLRGPQGTLFGRNSPAGVVKLESAKPQLGVFAGYYNVSDATYDTANFEGAINIPVGDKVAIRVSAQEQTRDNWVKDPINQTNLEGYGDFAGRQLQRPVQCARSLAGRLGPAVPGQYHRPRDQQPHPRFRPRHHLHRRQQHPDLRQRRGQRAPDLERAGLETLFHHRL